MAEQSKPENENTSQVGKEKKPVSIPLEDPVIRGETTISCIEIRGPKAGELRGLSLQDLMTSEVDAFLKIIPRISVPPLTQAETDNLDPADFAQCAGAVRGFFMTREEQIQAKRLMEQSLSSA